jgi:hypothetical protein
LAFPLIKSKLKTCLVVSIGKSFGQKWENSKKDDGKFSITSNSSIIPQSSEKYSLIGPVEACSISDIQDLVAHEKLSVQASIELLQNLYYMHPVIGAALILASFEREVNEKYPKQTKASKEHIDEIVSNLEVDEEKFLVRAGPGTLEYLKSFLKFKLSLKRSSSKGQSSLHEKVAAIEKYTKKSAYHLENIDENLFAKKAPYTKEFTASKVYHEHIRQLQSFVERQNSVSIIIPSQFDKAETILITGDTDGCNSAYEAIHQIIEFVIFTPWKCDR